MRFALNLTAGWLGAWTRREADLDVEGAHAVLDEVVGHAGGEGGEGDRPVLRRHRVVAVAPADRRGDRAVGERCLRGDPPHATPVGLDEVPVIEILL